MIFGSRHTSPAPYPPHRDHLELLKKGSYKKYINILYEP